MKKIDTLLKKSLKSALSKLTSYKRRSYAAELAHAYFDGSARKTERELGVSRSMVELGLQEQATGIRYIEKFKLRGSKKKKLP